MSRAGNRRRCRLLHGVYTANGKLIYDPQWYSKKEEAPKGAIRKYVAGSRPTKGDALDTALDVENTKTSLSAPMLDEDNAKADKLEYMERKVDDAHQPRA